jgi:hypothetical protein
MVGDLLATKDLTALAGAGRCQFGVGTSAACTWPMLEKKNVTTTQFPRRLIEEKAEVRQSQDSVPPFPHRGNIKSVPTCPYPVSRFKANS